MIPSTTSLYWLPLPDQWQTRLKELQDSDMDLQKIYQLAAYNLDFAKTNALNRIISQKINDCLVERPDPNVRLAVLGSSTTSHLNSAIRVAGMRRNLWVEIHHGAYGQYWQEIFSRDSMLEEFAPTSVLLVMDSHHLAAHINTLCTEQDRDRLIQETVSRLSKCWQQLKSDYQCQVIQQMPLPIFETLMGNNEHRLAGSRSGFLYLLAVAIRENAAREGVDLLSLDRHVSSDGITAWHDPRLWLHAKMEICPQALPMFGELLLRMITAKLGLSSKCLVLDLDNTLWGRAVGEVGIEGIVLGQGSTAGEAYQHFQRYVLELSHRGIILAVCSKNQHSNAMAVFKRHPEMVLKPNNIASFKANWNTKPANIRAIANELQIGLDSMVFMDDSPFERELVRRVLPSVITPELPKDPIFYPKLIADAGYFESLALTSDDQNRNATYQSNRQRCALQEQHDDMVSFLADLGMELSWKNFDTVDLARVAQLINKTNQFNLTTRRYSAEQIEALIQDSNVVTLQFRLNDRFGDNGIIAAAIVRTLSERTMSIDTLLMSCRVLGRKVEYAILNVIASVAKRLGAVRLIGEYLATERNSMVKDLYNELGFKYQQSKDNAICFELVLKDFQDHNIPIQVWKAEK